jgi:hypothetical protein|tara:strand:- start:5635 stop:6054 length:420 start_codon:yes stop_codon:yes gene_type:complete
MVAKTKADSFIIQGKAYWTKLKAPDEYSDKYQLDVGNLSQQSKKVLLDNGVKLKDKDDDRGEFVTPKSKFEVTAMDADKTPIDVQTTLIGNGSDVRVRVVPNSTHAMVDQYGTSLYLNKVQVINLIEYAGGDDDFDEDF